MAWRKGQFSFEFVIVTGGVLALLTLASFFVFSSTLDTKVQASKERTRLVANTIISEAEAVNRLGEGGFKVVELEMPGYIQNITSRRVNTTGGEVYLLNFTFEDGSSEIFFSDVYIVNTQGVE